MLPNLIVPTLSRYDLLERMIRSIDYPVKHLLIIDNGGSLLREDVESWLPKGVEKFTLLSMPSNLGVASSWNLGVKSFPHDSAWFIASDDIEFRAGGLENWHNTTVSNKVTISNEWPHFQMFSIGEEVIERVGLFDEALHPANFEDDDFRWRCDQHGYKVEAVEIPHSHIKQGTVFYGENSEKNSKTYPLNEIYFRYKQSQGDLSSGEWSLERRRTNSWE